MVNWPIWRPHVCPIGTVAEVYPKAKMPGPTSQAQRESARLAQGDLLTDIGGLSDSMLNNWRDLRRERKADDTSLCGVRKHLLILAWVL